MPSGKRDRQLPEENTLSGADNRTDREFLVDPLEVGPAPDDFNQEETLLWDEFVTSLPWLASSDRPLLIRAVRLGTRIDKYEALLDAEVNGDLDRPAKLNALRQLRDNTDKAYQGLVADLGGLPRTRPQVPISFVEEDAENLSKLADGNEEVVSFDD